MWCFLTGGQRRRLARAGLKGFVAFKFDKADDMVWLLQEKHPLTEEAWKIYEKELEEPDLGVPKTYKSKKSGKNRHADAKYRVVDSFLARVHGAAHKNPRIGTARIPVRNMPSKVPATSCWPSIKSGSGD
jgi:hypothetical protein